MKPTLHLPQVLHTLQQERENCIAALRHQNDDATALAYKQQLDAAIAYLALPISHWTDLNDQVEGELVELWKPREMKHKSKK